MKTFLHYFETFEKFETRKRTKKKEIQEETDGRIVLTMIGLSNSNKTRYQVGCQSRTNACI